MLKSSPPELVAFADYHGDWNHYCDVIYKYYMDEIVNSDLRFKNIPIRCQFRPQYQGKGFSFWHTISEGDDEESRTPDFRRCERIRWINWVISSCNDGHPSVSCWENTRKENTHCVLFFEEESYVVILAKRKDYYLFKTAYCANPRRKAQLIKEREEILSVKKG